MLRSDGTCSICTKKADNPYRHCNKDGNITEGCIDKCHDSYLILITNSYNWVMSCRKQNKAYNKK